MVRREVARCGIALILAFGDSLDVCDGIDGAVRSLGAFVVGNHYRASLTQLGGHQHGVQVELSAGAALALLGPVVDSVFGALDIHDGEGISPEVSWLRRQLAASGGQARIEPLMDETGWSRRLVTERFRAQLGLAPKAYARIVRFQRAVCLLQGVRDGHTLADVAIECGYYDQSHLTRDFVALAGCTPTALMAEHTGEPGVRFLQDDAIAVSVPFST
jgi:AraC-like DNA-binding protein